MLWWTDDDLEERELERERLDDRDERDVREVEREREEP